MTNGTIFIAADFILDDPWLVQVKAQLRARGYEVIDGPPQKPPAKTVYDPADYARYFGRTDVIVTTTKTLIPRELLESAPRLRSVVFPTIGTESIDFQAAAELGIIVPHGPSPQNFNSMAESTVMLILVLMYQLHRNEAVMRGELPRPTLMFGRLLQGKTLGLIGLGRIARGVVERMRAFGVRMVATTRNRPDEVIPEGVERVPLETLLRESEVVSLHTTLTPETRHMLGRAQFAMMKPGAYFVNTARGGMVDEDALYQALASGHLGGAALDAFEAEPLPATSPLRTLANVILTPHMIGQTRETYDAIPPLLIENIERVMSGRQPVYTKNPEVEPAWRARLERLKAS